MNNKTESKYANALTQRRKPYSYDIAMQRAIKRLNEQPVPITLTSNIRIWTDKGE